MVRGWERWKGKEGKRQHQKGFGGWWWGERKKKA